jgi:hypothetical protein
MIPSGGLDMTCRRCSGGFHVDMPERTQAGPIPLPPEDPDNEANPELTAPEPTAVGSIDPPLPQNVEPTRIGVVTPFAEPEEPRPESLLSPSGQIYSPAARFEAPPHSIDTKPDIPQPEHKSENKRAARINTPVTHGRTLPPAAAEMGLDPELDDTMRVDSEKAVPAAKQPVTVVGELSNRSGPQPKAEREHSIGSGPNGLYERVAAGVYVPEEPKLAENSGSRIRAKSWDEPSAYMPPSTPLARLFEPLRRAAVILNGAPLAFKVALVVFPLTLGIALMFTSAPEKERVEIKVEAATEEPPVEQPAKTPEQTAEQPPPPKKKLPEKRKAVMPGDDAAPEGHAYVQMDRARLRGEPNDNGEPSGRLELGQLVRTFDRVDGFVLVMGTPKGPAGFISEKLIAPKKPIAVLAKEIAFAACEVTEEYTIDDCLYQGKQQHDACIEACGVAVAGNAGEDSPTVRCAEACKVAFNECQRSCNAKGPGRGARTPLRAQKKSR